MRNKIDFLKNCLIIRKQNEQGQRSGPRLRLYNTPVTTRESRDFFFSSFSFGRFFFFLSNNQSDITVLIEHIRVLDTVWIQGGQAMKP